MSKMLQICCASCGKDLYLDCNNIRQDDEYAVTHIDMYVIHGRKEIEHLCPKCYAYYKEKNQLIQWVSSKYNEPVVDEETRRQLLI